MVGSEEAERPWPGAPYEILASPVTPVAPHTATDTLDDVLIRRAANPMLGPRAGGRFAVRTALELTDAVQVVMPARWSVTVIRPSRPPIVAEHPDVDPAPDTVAPGGTLTHNPPETTVSVTGVAAKAKAGVAKTTKNFVLFHCAQRLLDAALETAASSSLLRPSVRP
jgi:hypothetical protein